MNNISVADVSSQSGNVIKKDITAARRRINAEMVQDVLLIWLDNNIDENSSECLNTITQLQQAMTNINIFTDNDKCVEFLTDIENDKVCINYIWCAWTIHCAVYT